MKVNAKVKGEFGFQQLFIIGDTMCIVSTIWTINIFIFFFKKSGHTIYLSQNWAMHIWVITLFTHLKILFFSIFLGRRIHYLLISKFCYFLRQYIVYRLRCLLLRRYTMYRLRYNLHFCSIIFFTLISYIYTFLHYLFNICGENNLTTLLL